MQTHGRTCTCIHQRTPCFQEMPGSKVRQTFCMHVHVRSSPAQTHAPTCSTNMYVGQCINTCSIVCSPLMGNCQKSEYHSAFPQRFAPRWEMSAAIIFLPIF